MKKKLIHQIILMMIYFYNTAAKIAYNQCYKFLNIKQFNQKKPMNSLVYILSLVFLLGISVEGRLDDSLALKVGESVNGKSIKQDNFKSFQFINIDKILKKRLFVLAGSKLESGWERIGMNIYNYGGDVSVPLIQCSNQGIIDECAIQSDKLSENSTLLISIQCQDQCSYIFSSFWSDIENLQVDTTSRFMFSQDGKAQIYHMNLKDLNFTQLRVILLPETKRMPTDKVKIFGRYGINTDPTQQSYQFKSIDLWNDGQGLFLNKKDMKEDRISLLVVGQAQTVFSLITELKLKQQHKIQSDRTFYEHLQPNAETTYHLILPQVPSSSQIISFSTYSGNIEVKFFVDKDMKQLFTSKSFDYMGDSKLIIDSQTQLEIKQLFILVKADNHNAIYVADFNLRSKSVAIQLDQNINEFLQVHQQEMVYLKYNKWGSSLVNTSELTFNILAVKGSIKTQFRMCSSQSIQDCISIDKYLNNSVAVTHYDATTIGTKNIFKLKIGDQLMKNVNPVEKMGVMLVVFHNTDPKPNENKGVVVIQYNHENEVQNLRESRPLQEIIRSGQIKYYKFTNSDPNIKQIRIHLNSISGLVEMSSLKQDPRRKQLPNDNAIVEYEPVINPLIFKNNLTSPIYIKVHGLSQSMFGLTAQVIRHQDGISNSLRMSEDIQVKLTLKPHSSEIILLEPLFQQVLFDFKSTGPILWCDSKQAQNGVQCINNLPLISNGQKVNLKVDGKKFEKIVKIENPSKDRSVEILMTYHSVNQERCKVKKLGQFQHQILQNSNCLRFPLDPLTSDLDVLVERVDMGQLTVTILLCNNQYQKQSHWQSRKIVPQKDIQHYCSQANPTDWSISLMIKSQQKRSHLKIQYLVQYSNSMITLPDGIGYRTEALTTESALKYFYYEIINHVNTQIIVNSHLGRISFYAVLVERDQKYNTKLTKDEYQYKSNTENYFSNPLLQIKQDQIKCQNCALLVAVYSSEVIGTLVDFTIEIVQNSITLKDNKMKSGHLLKGSILYYNYYCPLNNSSLVVTVADNNQHCAKIYLGKNDFPSDSNNLMVENGNKLVYEASAEKYFIGVEAIKDCIYSITIQDTPYHLTKLQRGMPAYLQLKTNQFSYYLFQHISNISFKLVTMHSHGDVQLSLNKYDSKIHLTELKDSNKLQSSHFDFKGTNTVQVTSDNKNYCFNCYYILVVKALKETESSIMLVDQQTSIMLFEERILYDQIKGLNLTSLISLPPVLKGVLDLQIFGGNVLVDISSSNRSEPSHQFHRMNKVQKLNFDLTTDTDKFTWNPTKLIVKCLSKSCMYSIKLQAHQNGISNKQTSLTPGKPAFLYMSPSEVTCIQGFISDKKERIILTASRHHENILNNLEYDVQVEKNNHIELEKKSLRNILTLSFKLDTFMLEKPKPYTICIKLPKKTDDFLMITAQQTSSINLLPEDSETTVTNNNIFMIYPEGKYILDIFECVGNAMLIHGNTEVQVNTQDKMVSLQSSGIPNQQHVVQLESYQPVILKVESPLSIIRWMHSDPSKERGLGYVAYKTGTMTYNGFKDTIVISMESLKMEKQMAKQMGNTKIKNLKYTVYVSNDPDHLKSATQCQRYLQKDVMVIQWNNNPYTQLINSKLQITLNKKQILTKYANLPQNIYVNVVADLQLQVPPLYSLPNIEDYRFIYSQQEIPKDIFTKPQEEEFNLLLYIFLVFISILGVIIFAYLLGTKIIPLISRIRNRNLVQQKPENNQAQIIPPSSDRARITINKAVFDDQIKKNPSE